MKEIFDASEVWGGLNDVLGALSTTPILWVWNHFSMEGQERKTTITVFISLKKGSLTACLPAVSGAQIFCHRRISLFCFLVCNQAVRL